VDADRHDAVGAAVTDRVVDQVGRGARQEDSVAPHRRRLEGGI
jgi:hypothetical protein